MAAIARAYGPIRSYVKERKSWILMMGIYMQIIQYVPFLRVSFHHHSQNAAALLFGALLELGAAEELDGSGTKLSVCVAEGFPPVS